MSFLLLSLSTLCAMVLASESIRPGSPSSGFASLQAADQAPNASHSVSFEHSSLGAWNWTVRVSDVALANASQIVPNAHVAYTTYSFAWPAQGSLQDALNAEVAQQPELDSSGSCAILVDALLPPNVTAKFDGSSCSSMLGAECVDALTTLMGSVKSDCSRFGMSLEGVQRSCGSSFGPALGGGYGVLTARFGHYGRPSSNMSTYPDDQASLLKGQPYAYSVSEPFSAGNRSAFDLHASNVYILGLTGSTRTLLCNRPGSRQQISTNVSDNSNGANGNHASDRGAAPNLASNMGMMIAFLFLVVTSVLLL